MHQINNTILQPLYKNACMLYIYTGLGLNPISLAATFGISVDFFSLEYLDVSVALVVFT